MEELQNERRQIQQQIEATSTTNLLPGSSETDLIQKLVLQFLIHDGYAETAKAFAGEIHAEKTALNLDPNTVIPVQDIKEDQDAGHRQRKLPISSRFIVSRNVIYCKSVQYQASLAFASTRKLVESEASSAIVPLVLLQI